MDYRLLFIEGLPGTGKTTLSEYIYTLLTDKGMKAELLLEGNEKIPSNFCDITGVPRNEDIGFKIEKYLIAETDKYYYVDLNNCEDDAAVHLKRYDIGDEFNKFVSVNDYINCTLEWWERWVSHHVNDSVLILDSAYMQCPINEMIIRGASDHEVIIYIKHITGIITPLDPVCIYLRRESAKVAIDYAKKVKGVGWAKGLAGLVELGCADLFERRFHLENILLPEIPSIICNVAGNDWSDAMEKVRGMI